jgi:general secretion pathway protein K
MVILTLVATLAAGMVWQQSRSVQIEAAERSASQSEWILTGALDWARLILREDTRSGGADHLGEPWATPLAEARLSTFLAADKDNNADEGPEAFLSGTIVDAQSRFNLRNLLDAEGKLSEIEVKAFARLCDAIGLPTDTAQRVADALRSAWAPGRDDNAAAAPIAPQRVEQLTWLGIDPTVVNSLLPYVGLLPVRTAVNANTAGREVLLAAIDGLDLATAERIVIARQRSPFKSLDDIKHELPETLKLEESRVGVRTNYFDVYGRLRLEDRVLEQHSLVERRGADRGMEVVTLLRERRNLLAPAS